MKEKLEEAQYILKVGPRCVNVLTHFQTLPFTMPDKRILGD